MTNEQNDKQRKNYNQKNGLPVLVGIIGFLMLFTAFGIEDDRDKLTTEEAQDMVSEQTTLLMGAGGVAAMVGAFIWAKKQNKEH